MNEKVPSACCEDKSNRQADFFRIIRFLYCVIAHSMVCALHEIVFKHTFHRLLM